MVIGRAVLVDCTCWLPKLRLVGLSETTGAVPMPDKGTVCGLPVIPRLRVAVREPEAPGVNVTLAMQEAPEAKVCGGVPAGVEQLSGLITKSEAFAPVMVSERLGKVMEVAVLLVTLRLRVGADAMPTLTFPKARAVGFRVICESPVPVSATVRGAPGASLSNTFSVAVSPPLTVGANVGVMVQLPPEAARV